MLRTPTGFGHRIERTRHPASAAFPDVPQPDDSEDLQFSATELLDAIAYLREVDADQRTLDLTQLWESDVDEGLGEALDAIHAVA